MIIYPRYQNSMHKNIKLNNISVTANPNSDAADAFSVNNLMPSNHYIYTQDNFKFIKVEKISSLPQNNLSKLNQRLNSIILKLETKVYIQILMRNLKANL